MDYISLCTCNCDNFLMMAHPSTDPQQFVPSQWVYSVPMLRGFPQWVHGGTKYTHWGQTPLGICACAIYLPI